MGNGLGPSRHTDSHLQRAQRDADGAPSQIHSNFARHSSYAFADSNRPKTVVLLGYGDQRGTNKFLLHRRRSASLQKDADNQSQG